METHEASSAPVPGRRVIEGGVDARASDATASVNRLPVEGIPVEGSEPPAPPSPPAPFFYREVTHHRVVTVIDGADVQQHKVTLYERVPEGGPWPEHTARFQGLGQISGHHPLKGPFASNYRFDIPGNSLDEAWLAFDQAANAGATLAANQTRAQIANDMRAHADQLAAVQGDGAAREVLSRPVLDASGRPISR